MAGLPFPPLTALRLPPGARGPNEEGEIKSDDLADCIAGACGIAIQQLVSGLPKPEMVYMPVFRETGQMWSIGQGTYTQNQWNQFNQKFGIGSNY